MTKIKFMTDKFAINKINYKESQLRMNEIKFSW